MALRKFKPTSSGQRERVALVSVARKKINSPQKKLTTGTFCGHVGRSHGRVSTRHRQVGAKKLYRCIDFKRSKKNISAKVVNIEYDPNRGADIALIVYKDGEKSYILAPEDLKEGSFVVSGSNVEVEVGNCLPLSSIPLGLAVHNVELRPGAGGKLARGAGVSCYLMAKEGNFALLKMPSSEIRKVPVDCWATVGVLGNADLKNCKLGKAGRSRHLGRRPEVRGTAMHPDSHPHGGGEGRSPVGMPCPKTPWGKKAYGVRTRRKRNTATKYIISRRVK